MCSNMVEVKIVNLTKAKDGGYLVDHVSFEVKDKELFVIAGPPGSGKSAILRMVAGLMDPDEGDIYIDGTRVNDVPPHKRSISMVFQSLALYPNKTVFENIAFPLRVKKVSEIEINRRVKEVASLLRIEHILNKYPRFLSGGEQQRVAIARAIVSEPKLYLFDQPLANLDALIRANMREELKKIARELGATTIYVTHENVEALSLGDRIAYMEKGKIIDIGTPLELLNDPRDLRIARYFSDLNMIESEVIERGGRYLLDLFGKEIEIELKQSYKVYVATKASDLILASNVREEFGSNYLKYEGKITLIEEFVRNRKYHVEVEGHILRVISNDMNLRLGESVTVVIPKSKMMVFEGESFKRLL